ncbi:hypothetical protein K438DRAFT_1995064 [Mycena galopus ATCC 62051]|nr:hypothetical protein K438DRAFT_1995064 [Mycena galopus ATCC 62051]
MADFDIDVPAAYTVAQLKALVKAHLSANPQLMRDADYSTLFTKQARNTYLAANPPSPTPSPWHGIDPASNESSRAASPIPPGDGRFTPDPDPLNVEQETRLHHFQALTDNQLERALKSSVDPGESLCFIPASSLVLCIPPSTCLSSCLDFLFRAYAST